MQYKNRMIFYKMKENVKLELTYMSITGLRKKYFRPFGHF